MSVSFDISGDFEKTYDFLKRMSRGDAFKVLEKYGNLGVEALASATPVDSGDTASSWTFEVEQTGSTYSINWMNTNVNGGVNIAIILQTGHGTGTGGYVQGRDYINPAIQPVFDKIANEVWREVTK